MVTAQSAWELAELSNGRPAQRQLPYPMKSSTESRLGTSDAGSAQARACRMSSQPGCSWSCEAVAERDAPSGSPTCKQVIQPAPGIEPG